MGRVLYFHHYFPALLFASMISGNLKFTLEWNSNDFFFLIIYICKSLSTGVIIDYILTSLPSMLPKVLGKSAYQTVLGLIVSGLFYR